MSDKSPDTSKYYHFRVNDLSQEQYDHLTQVECEYMKIGEIEPNKTREGGHYHTIVIFSRSQRASYAKKKLLYNQKLSVADWYIGAKYTNNTVDNFIKYAIKNGHRFTKGTYVSAGKGANTDKVQANTEAIEIEETKPATTVTPGKRTEEEKAAFMQLRIKKARELDYDWFLKYDTNYFLTSQCKSLLANCQHRSDLRNLEELDNYYIYGEPGTGKSSSVDFLYPGCYRKLKTNEKWDSYSNYLPEHETVYFDELDTVDVYDQCMGGLEEFKTMTDVYPFPVRSNYGNSQINIRPKRFIITSNFTPNQVFCTDNKFGKKIQHVEMILKAFKRRFKVMSIQEFQELKGIYFDKTEKRTKFIQMASTKVSSLTPLTEWTSEMSGEPEVLFQAQERPIEKLTIDLDQLMFDNNRFIKVEQVSCQSATPLAIKKKTPPKSRKPKSKKIVIN